MYQVGSGICLSKVNIIRHLLEGTAASNAENLVLDEKDTIECSNHDTSASKIFMSVFAQNSWLFLSIALSFF